MKLFEIINESPIRLNEGVFSNLMSKAFGTGFKATVSQTIETLLNKTIDDLAKASGKVSLKVIKNNENYITALKQSIAEASIAKYGKKFADLTASEGDVLAKNVQDGMDAHLLDYAKKTGKLADADLAAARQTVNQTSDAVKAGAAAPRDLRAATKDLVVNQKMSTRVDTMKKVLGGFDQRTRTQIINLLKKDIKVVTDTGEKVSQQVVGETTIYSGGKLLKISKEQLKAFPGQVKRVIVNNPVKSALIAAGLTAAVLYLIFGDGTILTDEGGKAIDDNGQANEFLPCIQELIKSGEGKMVTSTGGQISVLVSPSDYPGGIKFYTNGRVFDVAGRKMGSYKCKGGQASIQEQDLMPFAYQYSRDKQQTPSQQNTTTSSKIGLSKIDIKWDVPGGGGTTPRQSTYHDCNGKSLPHEFGCRSEQIKQVQICLGLPEKYQTGNFGPITKGALEDKGIDTSNGLTQSIVDSVCQSGDEGTVRNREQIKLEPLAPRDIKINPINVDNLKLPNIKPLEVTPSQFYNALRDNGNIVGEDGNNRIKYKGPDLDDTQLGRLDSALSDMGYTRIKQLEDVKRYGSKYVWLKQ